MCFTIKKRAAYTNASNSQSSNSTDAAQVLQQRLKSIPSTIVRHRTPCEKWGKRTYFDWHNFKIFVLKCKADEMLPWQHLIFCNKVDMSFIIRSTSSEKCCGSSRTHLIIDSRFFWSLKNSTIIDQMVLLVLITGRKAPRKYI